MTKVSPNNGHETKSDILPWDIFKFDTNHIFLYQRLLKYFNDFQNQNLFSLNPNNGIETKSDFF